MKIEEIKVETIDENSRFVLKRIKTSEGEFTNRKIAISNFMFNCEQDRMKYERPIFNAPIQTHHIGWDFLSNDWDYNGLTTAREHADKNKRIFLAHNQRSDKQMNELKIKDSIRDFDELVDLVDNVPFQLPLEMTPNQWKEIKEKLNLSLKSNQNLVPIISSRHNTASFPLIIKEEIGKSKIIGINSYEISTPIEITNLSFLTAINSKIKINQETSLFVNFGYSRILRGLSSIAGCFAFSCFAGDIFSERAYNPNTMPKNVIKHMMDRKPTEYSYYDSVEKRFNKSLPQMEWYGIDLTEKEYMGGVSVAEGLNGYQVIKCISHFLQQRDLDLINSLIISKSNVLEAMKNYTGWNVFLSRVMLPLSSNQKNLSEF